MQRLSAVFIASCGKNKATFVALKVAAAASFHSSTVLHANRWTPQELEKLDTLVDAIGPSWDLVAASLPGRKAAECRGRYHRAHIDDVTPQLRSPIEVTAHLSGFVRKKVRTSPVSAANLPLLEPSSAYEWIDVPLESRGSRTFLYFMYIPKIAFAKTRTLRKKGGWHAFEDLATFEAYEEHGPAHWDWVAARLRHRTPTQCRARLYALYARAAAEAATAFAFADVPVKAAAVAAASIEILTAFQQTAPTITPSNQLHNASNDDCSIV